MKKTVAGIASLLYLASAGTVFGQITISPPPQGYKDLGAFVTNILQLAFAIALVVVMFMLIWGSFEWITSGGDKDHVANARNRIINALVGLAVLAIAFAVATIGAQFLGFPGLGNLPIPSPR